MPVATAPTNAPTIATRMVVLGLSSLSAWLWDSVNAVMIVSILVSSVGEGAFMPASTASELFSSGMIAVCIVIFLGQ